VQAQYKKQQYQPQSQAQAPPHTQTSKKKTSNKKYVIHARAQDHLPQNKIKKNQKQNTQKNKRKCVCIMCMCVCVIKKSLKKIPPLRTQACPQNNKRTRKCVKKSKTRKKNYTTHARAQTHLPHPLKQD